MASKRETLLEYLKTLLTSITVANGYGQDIRSVERGIREIREMGDDQMPALFITMTHEKRNRITKTQFRSDLQVIIVGYIKNSKGDLNSSGTGVELDLDRVIEDVTKAIGADPLQGNRVFNTEITDIASDDGDLFPTSGFAMSVVFSYASEELHP